MRFFVSFFAVVWLLAPQTAHAAPPSLWTAELTHPEIAAALKDGFDTILIPTGGVEQAGGHLITGKHNYIVTETAARIASKRGRTLIAPVVPFAPEGAFDTSQGNMRYPGTITLREETFAALLEDIARSYQLHGFKTVLLIGDHGGSQEALKRVAAALPGVVTLTGYYADNGQTAVLKRQGFTDTQIGQHAGMLDTSELLAVYPAGVRVDALKNSANPGGSGTPGLSTAELGRVLLQLKVDAAH